MIMPCMFLGTAAAGGAGQTQSPETRSNAPPPGGSPTDAQRQQQHMLHHLTPVSTIKPCNRLFYYPMTSVEINRERGC